MFQLTVCCGEASPVFYYLLIQKCFLELLFGRLLLALSIFTQAADVHKLIEVLQRLVDAGNSVLIIEHNPDIVKVADWLIDLGPEGGDRGGELIAEGTPEEVIKVKKSYTGQFLKAHMK